MRAKFVPGHFFKPKRELIIIIIIIIIVFICDLSHLCEQRFELVVAFFSFFVDLFTETYRKCCYVSVT